MKLLRFGMPGGIAIFALMLVAVMVSVVGFGAIMFSVTAADSTDEETQAQAVSSRCTPGASPDNAPDEYQDAISWAAEESGLSQEIITAQLDNESGFDPDASSGKAHGIAQFTEGTWADYGEGDIWDPQESIKAQGRYMKVLMDKYEDQAEDEEEQVILARSEEHTSELQSRGHLVCRLPLEKKKQTQ